MSKWLGKYFGWHVIVTVSTLKDECFNDFQLSATLSGCYSIDNRTKIKTDKKYFIFELASMRLFELRLEKETQL